MATRVDYETHGKGYSRRRRADPRIAARIEAALGEAGFAADLLAEAGGLKLFALAGYVQADDGRLARAPGRLSGVIGAAPTGLP